MFDAAKREADYAAWLAREGLTERPIVVHITDTTTGETRDYRTTALYDLEGVFQEYLWSDGNYACDCNRGADFASVVGDSDADFPCGDVRFFVKITNESGVVIYEDDEP